MKKLFYIFAIGMSLLFMSCVSRLGAFTVISTKNIDWSRAAEYQRYNTRVKGKDICHIIIFVPTKFTITIEDAVDDALSKVPGGIALIDAVLREHFIGFPLLYYQEGYVIEGSVLIDPKLVKIDEDTETVNYQCYYDKNKNLIISQISDEELYILEEEIFY